MPGQLERYGALVASCDQVRVQGDELRVRSDFSWAVGGDGGFAVDHRAGKAWNGSTGAPGAIDCGRGELAVLLEPGEEEQDQGLCLLRQLRVHPSPCHHGRGHIVSTTSGAPPGRPAAWRADVRPATTVRPGADIPAMLQAG